MQRHSKENQPDEYDKLRDFYQMFRGQIEHEDELINQRITWTLTAQGFLFLAYSAAGGIQNALVTSQRTVVCTAIAILGVFLSFTAFWGVFSALRSLAELHKHFDDIFKEKPAETLSKTWRDRILNAFLAVLGLRWNKSQRRIVRIIVENRGRKNKMGYPPISGGGAFDLNELLGANIMIEAIPVACAVVWSFLLNVALHL
jgi:hypothetical protein